MVTNRRRFLVLAGTAMTGLWLAGTGLIRLSRRMVIAFGGSCSFCDRGAEAVFGLAGTIGRPDLICNQCIEICLDILKDDPVVTTERSASPPPTDSLMTHGRFEPSESEIEEVLRRLERSRPDAELGSQLEQLRGLLAGSATGPKARHKQTLECSFCDRNQHEAQKLIAGPRVFICDACIADAAALIRIHC